MAERVECPDCHAMFTRNGLPLHRLAKHSGVTLYQGASESTSEAVKAIPFDISNSTKKEVKSMEVNEVREVFKAERAEEKRAAEIEELKNALNARDESLSELNALLKAAQEKAPEMIDPFEHYKTCKDPDCSITKGFNALITNAQKPESLTPEQVKAAMENHKIFEGPERIVITGLGSVKK